MTLINKQKEYRITLRVDEDEHCSLNEYVKYNGIKKNDLFKNFIKTLSTDYKEHKTSLEQKIDTLLNQRQLKPLTKEDLENFSRALSTNLNQTFLNQNEAITNVLNGLRNQEEEDENIMIKALEEIQKQNQLLNKNAMDNISSVGVLISSFVGKANQHTLRDLNDEEEQKKMFMIMNKSKLVVDRHNNIKKINEENKNV